LNLKATFPSWRPDENIGSPSFAAELGNGVVSEFATDFDDFQFCEEVQFRFRRTSRVRKVNEVLCAAWADTGIGEPLTAGQPKLDIFGANTMLQARPGFFIERWDYVLTIEENS